MTTPDIPPLETTLPNTAPAPSMEVRVTDLMVRLVFLGLFAYWSLELARPFLPMVIWAVILTVALYPLYAWLARHLGGRQGIAAFIVTAAALLTLLGPFSVLVASLMETVQWLVAGLHAGTLRVPPPPPAVTEWPVVGRKVHEVWALASANLDGALERYAPVLLPSGATILTRLTSISGGVLTFVISIIIMGFLFRPGPRLAEGVRAFVSRLVAPRGTHFVDLAGATVRNVSRGVIGVALVQTLLAGVLLVAAGVPGAGLLAFAILVLCIVQIGPVPVLLPVVLWAWSAWSGSAALILTAALLPVALIDNILKPVLMGRGLTTPLLVILIGVLGGTISHGLIGIFLGPIVLAVFYELVLTWMKLSQP